MRRTLWLAPCVAAVLSLAGFGSCGGTEAPKGGGGGRMEGRGAVSEDLVCFAAVSGTAAAPQLDAGLPDAGAGGWIFDMPCYRSLTDVDLGAGVGLILTAAPQLGKAYGFGDPAIELASATRYTGATATATSPVATHEATDAPGAMAVGALVFTFTALPGPADLPTAVHGTVTGTLPATAAGSGTIAIAATF